MFSASNLTSDQIEALRDSAAQGGSMSDLQKLLKEEFGISITYMDTRFLILDLGIDLIEESKQPADSESEAGTPLEPELIATDEATPAPTGSVNVSMDSVAVPGALVSGKVAFSDGETAAWMLDQMGRMGLEPETAGYRPSEEDITDFQNKLRSLLEKGGF